MGNEKAVIQWYNSIFQLIVSAKYNNNDDDKKINHKIEHLRTQKDSDYKIC